MEVDVRGAGKDPERLWIRSRVEQPLRFAHGCVVVLRTRDQK
jgi:hypothetical protein